MKFTLSWLKKFLDTEASLQEISDCLDKIGLEVEEKIDHSDSLSHFEVAEIISAEKHPSADKLKLCKVLSSEGELQIVCGAPNARAGIKVVLAKVGTLIPSGNFKIKKAKIRDVESCGMMCSADEIGIPGDSDGIIELENNAKIGDNPAKYLGLDDPVIEIAITPNRGDALGVYGIARDLAAAGIGTLKNPNFGSTKYDPIEIIEDPAGCRAFFQIEISGLENKQSPDWLQNYLKNIGSKPISALVDITNYICITYGRPMHAYDKDSLSGSLRVSKAKDGEKFEALDDKIYELSKDDLVIRDNNGPQALAGIIGGKLSSSTDHTTNVLLESAYFSKEMVTNSGRRHQIETDSRYRFERHTDIAMVIPAALEAAKLVQEICGGKITSNSLSGSVEHQKKTISIDQKTIEKLTGTLISIQDSAQILSKLGFKTSLSGDKLSAEVPSWRLDVSIKEDLVEEIVRIKGFDSIPAIPVDVDLSFRLAPNLSITSNVARRMMASLGYDELVTFSFVNSQLASLFSTLQENLHIKNPISSELDYMRPSILPNLLEAIKKNSARSIGEGQIFEVGPIFRDTSPTGEEMFVSAACWGKSGSELHGSFREYDIYDVKADLEILLSELGLDIGALQIKNDNLPNYMHPHRSGQLMLGKNLIGYFGEIHPIILKAYDIEKRIIFFEISLNKLPLKRLKYGKRDKFMASDFQPNVRDFAFLINQDMQVGAIEKTILALDKSLIKHVEIFDIYQGEHIPDGKISVAIRVIIQSADHTLSEQELVEIHKKIVASVEKNFAATLRS